MHLHETIWGLGYVYTSGMHLMRYELTVYLVNSYQWSITGLCPPSFRVASRIYFDKA